MIAAGKAVTENDRKGQELYRKLLADIDRENGCKCGYGSKLRGCEDAGCAFSKNPGGLVPSAFHGFCFGESLEPSASDCKKVREC